MAVTETVLREVAVRDLSRERDRQDRKWGPLLARDFNAKDGLVALVEEVGEVARALHDRKPEEYREELVHVAAVAVAMIQAHDHRTQEAQRCV